MNRSINTPRRMLVTSNPTERDFYPSASFDILRTVETTVRLSGIHPGGSAAYLIPYQVLVLENELSSGLNLRSIQLILESYPGHGSQRTRQVVPTHQDQSRSTHSHQDKALKKLKKEFYTPKPKRSVMRLYYRENPSNIINEKEDEDLKRCAICLEDFEREEVVVTPCNHMFHEECIVPWVNSNDQCPVCRSAIRERRK